MRYAFVFVSIVVMWVAMLLIARTSIDALFLYVFVLALTLVLFLIGFRGAKRR